MPPHIKDRLIPSGSLRRPLVPRHTIWLCREQGRALNSSSERSSNTIRSTVVSPERILLVSLTGSAEFPFADRKTDSESVGFSLNGTHSGRAKLHVTHSKDETSAGVWGIVDFNNHSNLFSFNNLAERVGLCSDQFQKSQQQWKNRSIPL